MAEKGNLGPAARAAHARRRPTPSGATRTRSVWIFTTILALVGAGMFVFHVMRVEGLDAPFHIPWWALAILFYVTETTLVHVEFGRDQYWFSISEIPLVLGLFFAAPVEFVAAQVIGASAALVFNRRQSRLKVAFNSANYLIGSVAAASVFHAIVGMAEPVGLIGWLAAGISVLIASLIAVPAIFIAISLNDGEVISRRFWRMLSAGLFVSLANAAIGLVGATVMWKNPTAVWILLVPSATLFVAYRAYSAERQKRENLDFLLSASRVLQGEREVDQALVMLLRDVRGYFSGEIAEALFLPANEDGIGLRTVVHEGDPDVMEPIDVSGLGIEDEIAGFEAPAFLDELASGSGLAKYLAGRSFDNAMIAPLHGEARVFGFVAVANQIGDVGRFDPHELKLLEALANQTSVSLENGRLEESLAQLHELKEELDHQATHDPLTGLANRALFRAKIDAGVSGSRSRLAILFLDLDDFKTVNDSLGHAAGDSLLVAVAERLNGCLRGRDSAARLGGDEFGVLVEDIEDPEDAIHVAERVTRTLASPFSLGGKEVFVHASVGIAFAEYAADSDTLLRNADVAMYKAKGRGKATYAVYEASMHTEVVHRLELKAQLERSVADERFVLYYQPVVSMATGAVVGAEALLRWKHPERGLLSPSEFVWLAEETGLMVPISHWVITNACAQLDAWRTSVPAASVPSMSVNISPRHIHHPEFVDHVVGALRAARIEPGSLVVELTENVLMDDPADTLNKLSELKTLGVRIALDDFGSGFSSVGHLKDFPLDTLKIPNTFVADLVNGDDTDLVEALIKLGRALDLSVTAEGIENEAQLEALRRLGCDEGQGYYFSGPLTADAFATLLPTERRGDFTDVTLTLP